MRKSLLTIFVIVIELFIGIFLIYSGFNKIEIHPVLSFVFAFIIILCTIFFVIRNDF